MTFAADIVSMILNALLALIDIMISVVWSYAGTIALIAAAAVTAVLALAWLFSVVRTRGR